MVLITEVPLTKTVRKTYERGIIISLLHHIGENITTQLLTQFGIIVTLNARDARYAVFLYIYGPGTPSNEKQNYLKLFYITFEKVLTNVAVVF